ncbi:MAG: hypothetical protein PUC65_14035 [Clostridiales bacterium]|nr:hypothetical protein [Clostridiales bacterium]
MGHKADLLFVYEPCQTILEELEYSTTKLEFKPIVRDALVFIINQANPISSLTKNQILSTKSYLCKSDINGKTSN